MEVFINETELKFDDISSETFREYIFPNGQNLVIVRPTHLNVSKSGGHRLKTAGGECWYVQPREGWAIKWRIKRGQPNFVK